MSAIHSFAHEHAGDLAGIIPVYLPEQDINLPGEIEAKVGDILLGGGGGELAAYTFRPEEVILDIVDYVLFGKGAVELTDVGETILQQVGMTVDEGYVDFMDVMSPLDEPAAWPSWSGDEWFHIVSAAMAAGYSREEFRAVEWWIRQELGAWVLTERTDLLTIELSDVQQALLTRVTEVLLAQTPPRGVLTPPE